MIMSAVPLNASAQSIYRFYSPTFRSHFYTASATERADLISSDDNWNYEGVFGVLPESTQGETDPLYRFYSTRFKSHFFTASISERDALIAKNPNWTYEGVAYTISRNKGSDFSPVFRFWSPRFRSHFFTMSTPERNRLISSDPNWTYEGIAYYLLPPDTSNIFTQDFDHLPTSDYTDRIFASDTQWSGVRWTQTGIRAHIVSEDTKDKKLRITYPASSVGTNESGTQARIDLGNEYDELFFRQSVTFGTGFNWQRGGKLPGLASDGTTWSGGKKPSNGQGFSARYMWRDDGRAVIYLYHADQKTSYGDEINLGFDFKTGRQYTLTQRIVSNTGDKKNGLLEVWVSIDGGAHQKVLSKGNVRFGNASYSTDASTIDTLYFSTYHGGSDNSWAPENTSYATFDNLTVTPTRFSDLK